MIVKEHIKIIPAREEKTYTYHGQCPVCGFEQIYQYKSDQLDKECSECRHKREAKEKEEFLIKYIGSTVLSIIGNHTIIVKATDKKVYKLWFYHDENDNDALNISEIHEGNAEWFL